MKKVKLKIIGLTYSQSQNSRYALILGEEKGPRKLPIVIGSFEAQSIAIALEKNLLLKRPLTHDLLTTIALSFNVYLKKVIIHKLNDGVFFSYLELEQDGEIKKIDSRTSDAVALALRFNCNIYTYESILNKAGIVLDEKLNQKELSVNIKNQTPSTDKLNKINIKDKKLINVSKEELQSRLEIALSKEDYKIAALLRDEINRRNTLK